MAAPFDRNDDSIVVVIGTGAGGGVVANELAQKGVSVVALEAGGRYLPQDYVNDEWDSFAQLAWTDPRTTSGDWRVAKDISGLPAWIVKWRGGYDKSGRPCVVDCPFGAIRCPSGNVRDSVQRSRQPSA